MLKYNKTALKAWAKSKIPFLIKKRFSIVLAVIALLLLFLFRDLIQMLAVMAAFIILGVFSLMYGRWFKPSIGVELIMLGTVTTGMIYGTIPAIIVGWIALFFAEVLTNRFTYSTFISFIGLFVIALVIPLLQNLSITWVGILMTLLYDLIIAPGYLLMGSHPWKTIVFVTPHIIFNLWVFVFVAPLVFRLLA